MPGGRLNSNKVPLPPVLKFPPAPPPVAEEHMQRRLDPRPIPAWKRSQAAVCPAEASPVRKVVHAPPELSSPVQAAMRGVENDLTAHEKRVMAELLLRSAARQEQDEARRLAFAVTAASVGIPADLPGRVGAPV